MKLGLRRLISQSFNVGFVFLISVLGTLIVSDGYIIQASVFFGHHPDCDVEWSGSTVPLSK